MTLNILSILITQNITFVQKVAKKDLGNQGRERMFLVPLVHLEGENVLI